MKLFKKIVKLWLNDWLEEDINVEPEIDSIKKSLMKMEFEFKIMRDYDRINESIADTLNDVHPKMIRAILGDLIRDANSYLKSDFGLPYSSNLDWFNIVNKEYTSVSDLEEATIIYTICDHLHEMITDNTPVHDMSYFRASVVSSLLNIINTYGERTTFKPIRYEIDGFNAAEKMFIEDERAMIEHSNIILANIEARMTSLKKSLKHEVEFETYMDSIRSNGYRTAYIIKDSETKEVLDTLVSDYNLLHFGSESTEANISMFKLICLYFV